MPGESSTAVKMPESGQEPPKHDRHYGYLLEITQDELALIQRHRALLLGDTASFAQRYYDYVFAHPASAIHLYQSAQPNIEAGARTRAHIEHLLSLWSDPSETAALARHRKNGWHHLPGLEPAWLLGAYHLCIAHLHTRISEALELPRDERIALEEAVCKLLFRDLGLAIETLWQHQTSNGAHAHQHAAALLGNIPQALWSVDVINDHLLYTSPAVHRLCEGACPGPIPCLELTLAEDRAAVEQAWQRALTGEYAEVDSRVRIKGQRPRWYRRKFYPSLDESGRVIRIDGLLEDITEAHKTQEQLTALATTDALTGLANRTLWYDRVNQAIASARRNPELRVVLMLINIRHFKIINDTLGHAAGDRILRQVGRRLKGALRDSDTLAHLGGDEFSVLLPAVENAASASELVATKVHDCFHEPFTMGPQQLYLGAAIGTSIYPEHGADADSLHRRADIAMHGAKGVEESYACYDHGADHGAAEQLQLSGWLRQALEHEKFELYYQPKVDLRRRIVSGVEALLRWNHPEAGMIAPDRFIPLAEQIGLIAPITDWVLITALNQCRSWSALGLRLRVAVNVSARTFQNPRLADKIRWALNETQVSADYLELEITENTLMADIERGAQTLAELAELGVAVAIDDFGTGYSSFAYLKRLPIQTLKIDKSFLADFASNPQDAAIVQSIIELGHNLGYQVIAEGVQDPQAWARLEEMGCDAVQGFHVSHPLPFERLDEWLTQSPWPAQAV
jgi:diguanylate cyclase (GGDEF)-like protein